MKILVTTLFILYFLFTLANCITVQYGNPSGTSVVNKGNNGFSGSSFDPKELEGEACATSFFALFALGDASIQRAANKADIKNITSVSIDTKQNWLFYQDVCTVVRGN